MTKRNPFLTDLTHIRQHVRALNNHNPRAPDAGPDRDQVNQIFASILFELTSAIELHIGTLELKHHRETHP